MKEWRTALLCVPTLIRFLVWEPAWTLCPCRAVSDEEILAFIQENLIPEKDSENAEVLDKTLAEINRLNPDTLEYYRLPLSWETNGLAKAVRELYGIPEEIDDDDDSQDEM